MFIYIGCQWSTCTHGGCAPRRPRGASRAFQRPRLALRLRRWAFHRGAMHDAAGLFDDVVDSVGNAVGIRIGFGSIRVMRGCGASGRIAPCSDILECEHGA